MKKIWIVVLGCLAISQFVLGASKTITFSYRHSDVSDAPKTLQISEMVNMDDNCNQANFTNLPHDLNTPFSMSFTDDNSCPLKSLDVEVSINGLAACSFDLKALRQTPGSAHSILIYKNKKGEYVCKLRNPTKKVTNDANKDSVKSKTTR